MREYPHMNTTRRGFLSAILASPFIAALTPRFLKLKPPPAAGANVEIQSVGSGEVFITCGGRHFLSTDNRLYEVFDPDNPQCL